MIFLICIRFGSCEVQHLTPALGVCRFDAAVWVLGGLRNLGPDNCQDYYIAGIRYTHLLLLCVEKDYIINLAQVRHFLTF